MDNNGTMTADPLLVSHVKFGPPGRVRLDKDFFLAEWNSLRGEIGQRISQQTTLYEIAITAWGLILGYSLEKVDDKWFNDVLLICVYPMLAFLISSGWAFTQTRICQIAQYLRAREKIFTEKVGLVWWENYVNDEPEVRDADDPENVNPLHKHGKIIPAVRILVGTQLSSILIAIILTAIHIAALISASRKATASNSSAELSSAFQAEMPFLVLAIFLILVNFSLCYHSYKSLKKSVGSTATLRSTVNDIGHFIKSWFVESKPKMA